MTPSAHPRSPTVWIIAAVALVFGLATIKEGGAVLFGSAEARAAAGNYIPFIVWFNFLAGFAYVASGVGLWLQQRWATALAVAIAVATALASVALGFMILSGMPFEMRTVFAMGLRTVVWVTIATIAWRHHASRAAA